METHKTYKLEIKGKVQGVWFRASAKEKAMSLGLTGKVWNEYDGDVGIIVQGPLDKILSFIEWCKEGPPQARVDDVIEQELIDYKEDFERFDIVKKR